MAVLAENISRAINDFDNIRQAIIAKDVDVPSGTPTSQYPEKIREISGGDMDLYEFANFNNWATLKGYTIETKFSDDGNTVTEKLIQTSDRTVVAVRTTVFLINDSVEVTVSVPGKGYTVKKVINFLGDGTYDVKEVIG